MTASAPRRRAMTRDQWTATQKAVASDGASSEPVVTLVERRKVLGVLEQGADGTVTLASFEPSEASVEPVSKVAPEPSGIEDAVEEVVWKCPIIDISKAVEGDAPKEDRLVTGIVLKPEETDAHKDIYSAEVIRDAAHDFLLNYNASTGIGYMHRGIKSSLQLVESWIAPVDMTIAGRKIRKGTWLMTVFVPDEDVWKEIKAGKITGFSIGGTAKVRKLQAAA